MWYTSRVDHVHRTTTALLEGLRDPAGAEWAELDGRFRPILRAFTRRLGLSDADADDVTQEALTRFLTGYREGRYDRTRGRLSSWLISIAHHCALELRSRQRNHRGESVLDHIHQTNALDSIWDEECRRVLLDKAMAELKGSSRMDPKTLSAFESLAFEQREPAEVARMTGLSVESVYAAKSRCLAQLREILGRLNQVYEAA